MDGAFDRTALGDEARRLLEALLDGANAAGRNQIPASVLLARTGLTHGGLMRARGELTRHGLLRTEPGFSANGRRGPNVYVLNLEALSPVSESDEPSRSGAEGTPSGRAEDLPGSSRGRHARRGRLGRLLRWGRKAS